MRSEKVPFHPTGYSPAVAEEHGPWTPLSVHDLVELLGGAPFPWWVAGGRAIDLFVGRETRPHADTDVQVRRRDQLAVQARLVGWDLHAADPPGALRTWARGEVLQPVVHDVWCRRAPDAPWALQLMLGADEDGRWIFRRDPRISCPLERFGRRSADGVPYVAPEVQLLFKARALLPKDEADFAVALPLLNPEARRWLADAVALDAPEHPWLGQLRTASDLDPNVVTRSPAAFQAYRRPPQRSPCQRVCPKVCTPRCQR